jgi:hypothetical protein
MLLIYIGEMKLGFEYTNVLHVYMIVIFWYLFFYFIYKLFSPNLWLKQINSYLIVEFFFKLRCFRKKYKTTIWRWSGNVYWALHSPNTKHSFHLPPLEWVVYLICLAQPVDVFQRGNGNTPQ